MASLNDPAKDPVTVDGASRQLTTAIEGVRLRPATTHLDHRGTLCEIFDPAWEFDDDPLVYVYVATVRPGVVKGWVVHRIQNDRLFVQSGRVEVVLFDARPESPTQGTIARHVLSDHGRGILRIPAGVYHAVVNIGDTEAVFLNLPSRPYDHANPDKYRLPIDTPEIPHRFPAGFTGG